MVSQNGVTHFVCFSFVKYPHIFCLFFSISCTRKYCLHAHGLDPDVSLWSSLHKSTFKRRTEYSFIWFAVVHLYRERWLCMPTKSVRAEKIHPVECIQNILFWVRNVFIECCSCVFVGCSSHNNNIMSESAEITKLVAAGHNRRTANTDTNHVGS